MRTHRRISPYWWCLIGMPIGWGFIAVASSATTDWHEGADPDNDWRFLVFSTLVLGSMLGVVISLAVAFVITIARLDAPDRG